MNFSDFKRATVLVVCLFLAKSYVYSALKEEMDTTLELNEVSVVREYKPYIEVIPAQKLEGEQLQRLNSHSVADAVRYFSGVQLKDYGSSGGALINE